MNKFTIHNVEYLLDPSKNSQIVNYDIFISALSSGQWENDTFAAFDSVKDSNKTAIDIGSWIGPTSIWLSKHFKKVIALEPDILAIQALKANLESSNCNNVEIIERPIYSQSNVKLFFGSNNNIPAHLGDSTSQLKTEILNIDDSVVLTITLSDILENNKDVSFIKVDIEGGEENIIPELFETCSKCNYKLFISFHYSWWKDPNINRFDKYFSLAINEKNIAEFIKNNPFGSLFLTFIL